MRLGKLGQVLTAREIFDLIRADLSRVEKEIGLESIASVETVTAISQYLHDAGGKRLRPSLLLLAAKLVGNGVTTDSAIRMAAVVEIIHAATLVHDDVIDAADTRRGRPSANVRWGNHTCVLAGDWLYMQAFQITLRERNFQILDLLVGLTQMMVEGELLQLERIGSIEITETDCMELVHRKTACLFSVCSKLGAIAAHGDDAAVAKLGDFAWNLGMAFQLVDDLLDFTSQEDVLGKPVGNDLREGKVTLPLVYALENASAAERDKVAVILRERSYESVPFSDILAMVVRNGGIDRVKTRAQAFTDKARALILEFPDSAYQRALYAVTDLITDRDH